MSEGEDPESKTEEASEKKLRDTIDQGKTPVSGDVGVAFGIFALLAIFAFLAEVATPPLTRALGLMLGAAGALPLRSGSDAFNYLAAVNVEMTRALAPAVLLIIVSGIAASFVQAAPQFVFERIEPDLSRISLRAGWSRVFGLAGLIETVKAALKIVIVGGAVILTFASDRADYIDAMRMEPSQLPSLTLRLLMHLSSVVAISLAVLALADLVWSKFKWRRDLRMSRQELKDEFKQSEGDPLLKARLRSLAMDRSRRRMMASVPSASFVIANPTHFAIALRYVREEGGAPRVVAKGQDLVALKIREIAAKHDIPVLERKELARAMFDLIEVDRMIPQEFYRPVAELIHVLNSMTKRARY